MSDSEASGGDGASSCRMLSRQLENMICNPDDQQHGAWDYDSQRLLGLEWTEGTGAPHPQCIGGETQAGQQRNAAYDEAPLEPEHVSNARHGRIFGKQPRSNGERLREHVENYDLKSTYDCGASENERIHVKADAARRLPARQKPYHREQPGRQHQQARIEEQPGRTEEQEEPQVAPSIAPASKVGCSRAAVGRASFEGGVLESGRRATMWWAPP